MHACMHACIYIYIYIYLLIYIYSCIDIVYYFHYEKVLVYTSSRGILRPSDPAVNIDFYRACHRNRLPLGVVEGT